MSHMIIIYYWNSDQCSIFNERKWSQDGYRLEYVSWYKTWVQDFAGPPRRAG